MTANPSILPTLRKKTNCLAALPHLVVIPETDYEREAREHEAAYERRKALEAKEQRAYDSFVSRIENIVKYYTCDYTVTGSKLSRSVYIRIGELTVRISDHVQVSGYVPDFNFICGTNYNVYNLRKSLKRHRQA